MGILTKNGKGNIPRIGAKLVMEWESKEKAENILKSIEADNYEFVQCHREENRIICESYTDKAATLLHTLDDLISCVLVADEVYRST